MRSAVMASIPDDVRELCDGCLRGRRVIFSPSSSLEWIGVWCFDCTPVEKLGARRFSRAL